jgi:hypothetical protein
MVIPNSQVVENPAEREATQDADDGKKPGDLEVLRHLQVHSKHRDDEVNPERQGDDEATPDVTDLFNETD